VDADVKRHNSQCDIKDIEDEISRLKTEIEELKVENEYLQQQIVDDLNKNDLIAD
jgi:FtsZ-binding cell division protein ZapB